MLEHRRAVNPSEPGKADSQVPDPEPAPSSTGLNPRVLLVEDDMTAAKAMKNLLETQDVECRHAEGYREAVRTAAEWLPDLLVCDIDLGSSRGGCEVFRSMRSAYPTLQGLSVSGLPVREAQQLSADAGFSAHLSKPFSADEFVEAVKEVMNGGHRIAGRKSINRKSQ